MENTLERKWNERETYDGENNNNNKKQNNKNQFLLPCLYTECVVNLREYSQQNQSIMSFHLTLKKKKININFFSLHRTQTHIHYCACISLMTSQFN